MYLFLSESESQIKEFGLRVKKKIKNSFISLMDVRKIGLYSAGLNGFEK